MQPFKCLRDTQSRRNHSCKDKRRTQRSHKSLLFLKMQHSHPLSTTTTTTSFKTTTWTNNKLEGGFFKRKKQMFMPSTEGKPKQEHWRSWKFHNFKCQESKIIITACTDTESMWRALVPPKVQHIGSSGTNQWQFLSTSMWEALLDATFLLTTNTYH